MAREIKFRVWDNQKKKIISLLEAYKHEDFYINDGDLKTSYDCIFLMQFTGLKDKNGKEIYEGDILHSEMHGNGEVKWGDYRWICRSYKDDFNYGNLINSPFAEVIGNIYENGESLKGK